MAGTRDARQRILEATADLVMTRGLDAATPAAIAERADAGKMSLYRHFSGKDELVAEALAKRDLDIRTWLIGDPAEAVKRLADTMPGAGRPPLAREPLPQADTTGPAFTEEAIIDAVNAAKTDNTVFAHEWTSTLVNVWDRLEIIRPGSMYMSAGGGLGWGLPGAIGLQLGDPSRRLVALLGDGAVHYSVSGLWTAAQHNIPVVFVVARNSEYRALKEFSRFMHDPDAPGMELPDIDIPGIATAYGIPSERVKTLSDLTRAVKDGLSSDRPSLVEIPQRRIADS